MQAFVTLSKSTRGRAAVKLVENAVSKPGIYMFGELLEQPNIAALRGSEHAHALELLELFAYGTYDDVKANPGKFSLTENQATKLKQLTVASAAAAKKTLSYEDLQRRLELPNTRALEDLVISCFYAGLVQGKLNHKEKVVHVSNAVGRDVRPAAIGDMLASLEAWESKAGEVLVAVDAAIEAANKRKAEQDSEAKAAAAQVEATRSDAISQLRVTQGANASAAPSGWIDTGYNPDEATRRGRPKRRHAQVSSMPKRG